MKQQKGFLAIFVVLGALVALGLIGGAFYLGTLYTAGQKNEIAASPIPSDLFTPAPSADLTDWKNPGNWVVYDDSNLKISFRYPKNVKVKEELVNNVDALGLHIEFGENNQPEDFTLNISRESINAGYDPKTELLLKVVGLEQGDGPAKSVAAKIRGSLTDYQNGTLNGIYYKDGFDYDQNHVVVIKNGYKYEFGYSGFQGEVTAAVSEQLIQNILGTVIFK